VCIVHACKRSKNQEILVPHPLGMEVVSDIDLHRDGTNRNPAESMGFPLERVQMLWGWN